MGKINIIINEYRVESVEFSLAGDKPTISFTIGLFDADGNRITNVMFSNDGLGLKFYPDKRFSGMAREMLILLDKWIEDNYLPKGEDGNK